MKVECRFPRWVALNAGWAIVATGGFALQSVPALAQPTTESAPRSTQEMRLQQRNEVPAEWLNASSEDKPTSASTLPVVTPEDVQDIVTNPPAPAAPRESFQIQVGQDVLLDRVGTRRTVSPDLGRLLPPTPVVLKERSTGRRVILDGDTTVVLDPNVFPTAGYDPTAAPRIASVIGATAPTQSVTLPADKVEMAQGEDLLYPLPFRVPLTSGFGMRTHPISGERAYHQGLDLGAAYGTPVLAAYSGQAVVAGPSGGLGNAVMLAHSDTLRTRYGHMSRVIVQPGDWIWQGDVIGYVGSTGNSTGPHLHFEVWERSNTLPWAAIDPGDMIQLAIARL
ncbi:MAG: M23 family metallopeptidase [Cyanobacteria bacterium J06648_11]